MDKMRKTFDCDVKRLNERTFEFTASTEDIDRAGESIIASGWDLKNFEKNPVITWAHNYQQPPIGRATKVWVSNNILKNLVEFPPEGTYDFADTIRRLTEAGFIKGESVGFLPIEVETDDDGRRIFKKQELLEIAICPVPSNPDALISAKAMGVITAAELELITNTNEPASKMEVNMDILTAIEAKAGISYQSAHPNGTPKADEDTGWDAGREVREAEVEDLKVMCALVLGDPESKTSYKLPHHTAKGHRLVWRAVAAAGAALMGARGGVDAPEADKTVAKAHLAKHYQEFDREPPWEKTISQSELGDEIDFLVDVLQKVRLNQENRLKLDELQRVSGGDMPVSIKIGAVLNRKNLERLEQIKALAQEVIDSAQREEESEKAQQPELTLEDIRGIVRAETSRAINKARGKIN